MRSNRTTSTTRQTALSETKSRGESVNQVTFIGRLVAAPELRETASGKHVTTVRVVTNGKSHAESYDVVLWGQLADFTTTTWARDASSTSRDGSRAASGRPPTAALDAASRLSPTVSRRSPPRAHRRLRWLNRPARSPRGLSPSPLGIGKSDPQRLLLGFSAPRVARSRPASRRSEPPLRSGSPGGLRPLPLTPCFLPVPFRTHEPRREGVAAMAFTITDMAELVEHHLVRPLRTTTSPIPTSPSSCSSSS